MPTATPVADNPKYLEIAEYLRRDIESGVLRAGDRLPTFVELRERFGTTPSTVDRAHAVLEREGLIVRGQGRRGTQVVGPRVKPKRHVIGCLGFEFRLTSSYPYWMHLLAGMQRAAEAEDFELLMLGTARRISWEKMDGVIVHDEAAPELIAGFPPGMPVVSVMLPIDGVPSVVADDFEGARRATRHLLQLGHQRIGALMINDTPLPQRRLAGYRAALHEAGITPNPDWVRPLRTGRGTGSLRNGARIDMAEWLSEDWKRSGVTAVLSQNDEFALGIIDAVHEAGLSVPDDISVIGFDGTEEGEHSKPGLTTVAVPLEKIGATAMELLLRQVREEHLDANVTTLPARLQIRQSTTAVKSARNAGCLA